MSKRLGAGPVPARKKALGTRRQRLDKHPIRSQYDPACKTCPGCFYVMANAVRVCWNCEHEFYPKRNSPEWYAWREEQRKANAR